MLFLEPGLNTPDVARTHIPGKCNTHPPTHTHIQTMRVEWIRERWGGSEGLQCRLNFSWNLKGEAKIDGSPAVVCCGLEQWHQFGEQAERVLGRPSGASMYSTRQAMWGPWMGLTMRREVGGRWTGVLFLATRILGQQFSSEAMALFLSVWAEQTHLVIVHSLTPPIFTEHLPQHEGHIGLKNNKLSLSYIDNSLEMFRY